MSRKVLEAVRERRVRMLSSKNIAMTIKPPRAYRELGSADNLRLLSGCLVLVAPSTETDLANMAGRSFIRAEPLSPITPRE